MPSVGSKSIPPSFANAPSAVSVWVVPLGSTTRTAEPNERTAGSSHGFGVGVAVGVLPVRLAVGVDVAPVCVGLGVRVDVGPVCVGVGPVCVGVGPVGVGPVGVGLGVGHVMPASATRTLPPPSNAIFTGFSS